MSTPEQVRGALLGLLAALDGCVVLTAEEAEQVRHWLTRCEGTTLLVGECQYHGFAYDFDCEECPGAMLSKTAHALLGGSGDVGPPSPGTGDDLPNPEIGMKC